MSESALIRVRRDTEANWVTADPVVPDGQMTYVTDTGDLRVGDGVLTWSALDSVQTPYVSTDHAVPRADGAAGRLQDSGVVIDDSDNVTGVVGLTTTGNITTIAPASDLHAATKKYVDDSITGLIDAAPTALDTLNELAAALGDDADFAGTVTTSLAGKVDKITGTDEAVVRSDGVLGAVQDSPESRHKG